MIMESAILPIEAYYGYAIKTNEKPPEGVFGVSWWPRGGIEPRLRISNPIVSANN